MWNETVTLYIDDASIRCMVNQGQRTKKWADVKLEPGLVKSSVVVEEKEVVARIKQLFESQEIKTRKVNLGFSGLHSLSRPAALPPLPKAMLGEAILREARRVLPVPLDQLYLTWNTLPSPSGKTLIFMAAIPRKTADSLTQALRGAGLEPCRMTIKPLVLLKALTVETAILVDVQPDEFDLVIVEDGIPQPIRTVTLPNEELSWEQKLDMIVSDLDRTIKFHDTNNPEKPLQASVPICISGELINKTELFKNLSDKSGHPVQMLATDLKGPEEIEMGRYMVNIVMGMKALSSTKSPASTIANLNLLPAPYQSKPISLTKVIGIPSGVAVAGLVVPMVMMLQGTSSHISAMQNELDMTNKAINQKTVQMTEMKKSVTDLQAKAKTVENAYKNFNQSLNVLTTQQDSVNGDLAIILSRLTPGITLNKISISGGTLTLTGLAPNQQDIYTYSQTILQYAKDLDLSGRYGETTISSLKTDIPKPAVTKTDGDSQEITDTEEDQTSDQISFVLTFKKAGK